MNFETVTTMVVDNVKEFFAPTGAVWKVIPRIGKAFLIALAVYIGVWVLSSIPSLIAPLIGIGVLWVGAYIFLGLQSRNPDDKGRPSRPHPES